AIATTLAYLYGHHPKLSDTNAFRVLAAASFLDLQVCRSVKFLVGGASLKVFHEMVSAGVEPNVHTYGALINGCGRAGEVAKAFGAYGILRSKVLSHNWDNEDELDKIENFTLSSSSANLGSVEALDKSKYMDDLRAVRNRTLSCLKHMLKEKLNLVLMLLKKLQKILRALSLGAPQTSSSSDPNEARRTAKLAKLDTLK
ncbi:hypothetical protein ABKV19_008316, partial [Rosa sericea]